MTRSKFIVVKHDAKRARLHYDLRFIMPKSKIWASFAVRKGLPTQPGTKVLAVRTHDHTEEEALFIGTIKDGYGAGKLTKFDDGQCLIHKYTPSHIILEFKGRKFKGIYHMISTGVMNKKDFKKRSYMLFKSKKTVLESYLEEIARPQDLKLVIEKNKLDAPLFKWRTLLARDLYGKFCDNKPCSMITYSWVHDSKKPRYRGDKTCIGGMAVVENPKPSKTKGYKVNAMIVFLFIDPDYRQMALGAEIVKQVISRYKKVFLTTDKRSSDLAKQMYKKYGFKIIGTEGRIDHWVLESYLEELNPVARIGLGLATGVPLYGQGRRITPEKCRQMYPNNPGRYKACLDSAKPATEAYLIYLDEVMGMISLIPRGGIVDDLEASQDELQGETLPWSKKIKGYI